MLINIIIYGWFCTFVRTTHSQQDGQDIAFVVLSQKNPHHITKAVQFGNDLGEQARALQWPEPKLHFLHSDFHQLGGWTIFPLLESILRRHQNDVAWLFVCAEGMRVKYEQLKSNLERLDASKDWFLGRALRDSEATIIHHFAFHDDPSAFAYPDFAAGFALSISLVRKLASRQHSFFDRLEFSIDAQHEFATFVWDDGGGVSLVDDPGFCIEDGRGCATSYSSARIDFCGRNPASEDVFFAIKSCKKLEDRVSVILQTWAKDGLDFKFFTDSSNTTYPRVNLGIPNTDRGHCSKTLGIINYVLKHKDLKRKPWLVITDDDTLLSVPNLLKLLSCYEPSQPIALGERYGYRTASQRGYDYITGGGGMVFSNAALKKLVESGQCVCPHDDTPDDMFLGTCLQNLGIPIIHSPHFHQARSADYPSDLLRHQEPISFHKFWMIDPIEEFGKWLKTPEQSTLPRHNEL